MCDSTKQRGRFQAFARISNAEISIREQSKRSSCIRLCSGFEVCIASTHAAPAGRPTASGGTRKRFPYRITDAFINMLQKWNFAERAKMPRETPGTQLNAPLARSALYIQRIESYDDMLSLERAPRAVGRVPMHHTIKCTTM